MEDTPSVPLVAVATLAGGLVAAALASRGISAVGKVALHELDYRAGYRLDSWVRALR